jgi:hypothetical protein
MVSVFNKCVVLTEVLSNLIAATHLMWLGDEHFLKVVFYPTGCAGSCQLLNVCYFIVDKSVPHIA